MRRILPLAVALIAVVLLGAEVVRLRRELAASSTAPREVPEGAYRGGLSPEIERELERIATLGYVTGSEPVPSATGVLVHDRDAAHNSLALFTTGSGPEAYLIDMDGGVVHRWSHPGAVYWARAFVLPDGGLFAIERNPPGLLRLTSESELVWRFDESAHHDLAVMPDGSVYTIVSESLSRPDVLDGAPVLDDEIVHIDAEGRLLERVSVLEAFLADELGREWLVDHPLPEDGDVFHTNSIEVFESGGHLSALLSLRSIDTVAVLDLVGREISWAMDGPWHRQHEAQLEGGNLIIFDNLGLSRALGGKGQSRVLEIDTETRELVWSYTEPGFFTHGAGAQQRLPNGNTLITESIKGRIIEVTPEGRVVWEYVNPMTLESDPDLVPAILRAERVPHRIARGWVTG